MRRLSFLLLAALLTLGLAQPAAATHLLGGEAKYRFLDLNGTNPDRRARYEVTFSIYYNCETGGPTGSQFPCGRSVLSVSIFNKLTGARITDLNNQFGVGAINDCDDGSTMTASSVDPDLFPFFRTSDSVITSPPPVGCNISAGCARVVNYTAIVELPIAGVSQGFHVVYADNARNNSVVNVSVGPMGQSPQVLEIDLPRPTAAFANTSPIFSDVPVPLICAGDTVTIINNAFDAEGDRLVYNFYAPYGSPGPVELSGLATYQPLTPVTYAGGYSFSEPFGPGGYAQINPLTGESKYLVPNQGDYVVGVQVSEFRTINGTDVLLTTINREIQLKVRTCQNNTAPSLVFNAGQTTRTVEEGEPANPTTFNVNASVAISTNSITLTATSPLLDGPGGYDATFNGQVGTAPNVPVVINGTGALVGNFVYNSRCGEAGVYNVNVAARDNLGCPIKTTSIPFVLTVRRPAAPTAVTGDLTVCPNSTQSYTATGAPTGTTIYQWAVTGGTIQGPATGATVSVLWNTVGTGSLSVAATSTRGCLSPAFVVPVEVFSGVTATLNGLAPTYCLNPTAPGVTLVGSPVGGTFSITGAGGAPNLVGNVFTPRVAGTFQLTYTLNDPNGCAAISTPFSVTVNPLPTVVLAPNLPATVCSNDLPITLAGTVNGTAATSGFTIDGNPATVFNPATLGAGPHVVALVGTGVGLCTATATRTVTINAAPTVLITGLSATYCQNEPVVLLTATANGAPITGANAVFTIDNLPATRLNPATLAVGVHVVRVVGTAPNACRDTASQQVEIKILPTLAVPSLTAAAYCKDAAPIPLVGTVNSVAGGTFTIDGIAATVLNPAALSVGTHVVVFSGIGLNACQDTLQRIVTINPLPVYTLAPFPTSVCVNAAPVTISFASTQTGTGAAILLDANPPIFPLVTNVGTTFSFTLNPAALGVGTYRIVYGLFPASTPSLCGNEDTLTITIRPLPVLAITGLQTAYCADAPPVTLTGTIDAVAGGTFTIDGNPATVLNPGTLAPGPHVIIIRGTGVNGCSTTDTTSVQINALPTVAFTGLNAAYCADAPPVPLAATVNASTSLGGVTFTIDGNAATTLTPATLTPGPHVVVATGTLTATGCRNTITQTVTINALPTVAITNLNAAYCANAPAVPLTSTLAGGAGTVTYTINGTANTTFNPATLGPGTYTVVATGTLTATTCQNTATQIVTINLVPTVAIIGLNPAYCQGDPLVNLAGSVTPSGAITFTVNGNATGIFDPSTLAPGTYTVTATGTDANSCVGSVTQTVVVNPRPAVAITGLASAYCVSAPPVTLAGTVTGGAGNVTFTVNNVAATSFDAAALGAGTYTVVATGALTATGCQNTTTQTVTVNPLPSVAITGLSPAYCQGDGAVPLTGTLNGSANPLTFTVNTNAATSFDPSTLAPGTYTVTATGTDANTCANTTTQTVTVNARPAGLTPTGPPSVCPGLTGVPYSVPPIAPGQTYEWTVIGGTVATGQGTASITVDFGAANPGASVSVVAIDGTTSCRSLPIALPVVVNQVLATQTPVGTPSFCVNGGPQTFSIPVPSPGSVYNWALSGTAVGTITGQGTSNISIAFTQPGTATLVVTETSSTPLANCFGTSAALTVNVLPAPDPTLVLQASVPATCAGSAVTFTLPGGGGTSTYQFTVDGAVQTGITGNSFQYAAATAGTYTIGVQETNVAGCVGPVITTPLTVNAVPTAAVVTGSATICPQGLTGQTYTVAGLPGSTFQWTVTNGIITAGQGTGSITVDFDGTAAPSLSVIETSNAGCAGPASPLTVALDASAPGLTLATVNLLQPATLIELTLGGLNAQVGQQVVVERRVAGSGTFQQVGTVAAPTNTFVDAADPNAAAYDYRVSLTNTCGTLLQSVEQTTIRVQATGNESSGDVTLTWNAYAGQPVITYEVLRKNAAGGYDVLGTTTNLTYTAAGIGREAFNQVFRVRAALASNTLESYSNETAVSFTNAVATYNIITPNGDNLNDRFVIDNATLYPNNELAIFNRWGREVYRRKNYDNSWDGGDLPAGTYFYLFTTANGQSVKSTVEIVK